MILAIIAALALVQSWFGVGLLLLGTPILLVLGFPFERALWILLPASLAVSTSQLWLDRRIDRESIRGIVGFAVPALALGLTLSLVRRVQLPVSLAVAMMLVITVVLRLHPPSAARVRRLAQRHASVLLTVIGLVHGLTNMGGSLLLDYAASRHTDRYAVRQQVALGYFVFVLVQLAGLFLITGNHGGLDSLGYAVVAAAMFLLFGRRTFASVSPPVFTRALNAFMLLVAGVLIWKGLH